MQQHPAEPNPEQRSNPMPKATVILSPFHNLSAGEVADQLGTLKAEIADLEAREKALRGDALTARQILAVIERELAKGGSA
jgi:hypothetical protein